MCSMLLLGGLEACLQEIMKIVIIGSHLEAILAENVGKNYIDKNLFILLR